MFQKGTPGSRIYRGVKPPSRIKRLNLSALLSSSTKPDVSDYAALVVPFLGGLRQPKRRIKDKRLQYYAIQPSSSGEIDLRISSSCTLILNESPPTMLSPEIHGNPIYRIYNQSIGSLLGDAAVYLLLGP
ncbi:unnamed protein product [Protopolystoma xenopodis]|uniref:Uncharacterized protein n=1 Tax=Protopolystoma xenopodis TaxID=117903 RepID=A0A3S5CQS7_9PLAT|nr:unnamed protein product [Protopolystoma xenopodis]